MSTTANTPALSLENIKEQLPAVLSQLQDAGSVLITISGRGSKAETIGETILQQIFANDKQRSELRVELNQLKETQTAPGDQIAMIEKVLVDYDRERAELDATANTYLANVSTAFKQVEAVRSPITQMLTILSSAFIVPGKKMNVAEKGSNPYRVQLERNKYAAELKEAQERRRQELERQQKKETEAGQLRAKFLGDLKLRLSKYLANVKQSAWQKFNDATLETFPQIKAGVEGMATVISDERIQKLKIAEVYPGAYHNTSEVNAIKTAVEEAFAWNEWRSLANSVLTDLRTELIDKLPSKLAQLEEIARVRKENAEKAAELQREQARHAAEERERLLQQQREQEAAINSHTAQQHAESELSASFAMAAHTPPAHLVEGPKSTEPLKLRVLDARGWTALLNFYITKEAAHFATLPQDEIQDLGKKSLSSLVTYALKAANDKRKAERIESPYLEYYRDTVAKTVKAATV